MLLTANIVHLAQVFFCRQVNQVTDVWILTDTALEIAADRLSNEFDAHPSPGVGSRVYLFWRSIGSNLRYDAEKILITLWHSDETA